MNIKKLVADLSIILSDHLGYYTYQNQQYLAISFANSTRNGNCHGLEVVVLPLGRVKKRVITQSYCYHFAIQLINHEGETTIYEAEELIFKYALDNGAVDVTSKPVYPDNVQTLLPAAVMSLYFLIEDCCEESC